MRPAALLLASALALSGCFGSSSPMPRDHYYRLTVAPLDADGLLRERPLLFSASDRAHEVVQYDYHYWTDPPTRMIQGQMVAYLQQSGLASSVVTRELRVQPDFEVSGKIKRLERLLGSGTPRVVAELELALIEPGRDRLVLMDTYTAEVASSDDSVDASVIALNAAMAEIFQRFVADVAQRDGRTSAMLPR